MLPRRTLFLALTAVLLVTGCGGDPGTSRTSTQPPAGASTTAVPATTAATTAAQPQIAAEAIEFLDCDSLAKQSAWWACRRQGGVAYIIEGDTARSVYDEIRKRSDYNPNSSTLHESTGGFIYLPGYEGFDQVITHVGPRPGMKVVDTDLL
jgi:hypothetical protein